MSAAGWQKLIPSVSPFLGEGNYCIDAVSEFLPPPRLGWKPYGTAPVDPEIFDGANPYGWRISEYEEAMELQPGLKRIGSQIVHKLAKLLAGDPHSGIARADLQENPFWPGELAAAPKLPHEKLVTLAPLALSRTQDDKGRVRWTLFGGSEQGPGKAFWKGFFHAPKKERPAGDGIAFFCRLLNEIYGETTADAKGLLKAGFRILPDPNPLCEHWKETLPSWAEPFVIGDRHSAAKVRYLLTFRPFGELPAGFRKAYLDGNLCLLPCPGSLVFWGAPTYRTLAEALPLAQQIPLMLAIARHRMPGGIRVPQSGFLHEPSAEHPHAPHHAAGIRNTYKRTHRWDKILRDEDELALIDKEDKLLHVLFSTLPDDLTLYDKPMARNAQLWTPDGRLLLDGPNAGPAQLKLAMHTAEAGGLFGYRFQFPAMRVGLHELYWHRPLVAYRDASGKAALVADAPLGYLTAYRAARPQLDRAVELWPVLARRPLPLAALELKDDGHRTHLGLLNVRKLDEAFQLFDKKPLMRSFARQLITRHRRESLEQWLGTLPDAVAPQVAEMIEPEAAPLPVRKGAKVPDSRTYAKSAKRSFEIAYWKAIASLSEGTFLNKNNADVVRDEQTLKVLPYHERHLEDLGEHLLAYYRKKIAAAGMAGRALAGDVPFTWRTDFDYSWMGGWLKNQVGAAERDLLIMIPGKDRSRAVIMADHYDTAYMADTFDAGRGHAGPRMAACGADDNHSATAAMMLAAPIFLEMSKKGQLGCDIWLVHLTGEEFPADCLGARALTQRLVERTLKLRLPGGEMKDLSNVVIEGLFVSDMIAHNNDREKDVFQISPGVDPQSMRLALHAHVASEIWNASVPIWNLDPERAGKMRGRRSPHGGAVPEIAPFLHLDGQIRPAIDPKSTLYNTDGQMFSDAGVPCVLFMENYDINRTGYHDTHDTMENIDLDYGAAFCAITIESVARTAGG